MVAFRGFELAVLTVFPRSGFRYCCPRRKFPITMNATAQPDTRSFTTPHLCTGANAEIRRHGWNYPA